MYLTVSFVHLRPKILQRNYIDDVIGYITRTINVVKIYFFTNVMKFASFVKENVKKASQIGVIFLKNNFFF